MQNEVVIMSITALKVNKYLYFWREFTIYLFQNLMVKIYIAIYQKRSLLNTNKLEVSYIFVLS